MKIFIATIVGFLLLSLSGCVSYKAVGRFDNQSDIFVGNVDHNLMSGGGKFEFSGIDTGINCLGVAARPDKYPLFGVCAGQEGNATGQCSDGQKLNMRWYATTCTTGFGNGKSSNGLDFRFTFGLSEEEAMEALNTMLDSNLSEIERKIMNQMKKGIANCRSRGLKEKTAEFRVCVLEVSN